MLSKPCKGLFRSERTLQTEEKGFTDRGGRFIEQGSNNLRKSRGSAHYFYLPREMGIRDQ